MNTNEETVRNYLEQSKTQIRLTVRTSKLRDHEIISNYTAAIAGNFTDFLGRTLALVRHALSSYVLKQNLGCESVEDHVGMLLGFASKCHALPGRRNYRKVEIALSGIRALFRTQETAGLAGLALIATLENTSEIFIPDLARRGRRCGCKDFSYTDAHGVADREHSKSLYKALIQEVGAGYRFPFALVSEGSSRATFLIQAIYS